MLWFASQCKFTVVLEGSRKVFIGNADSCVLCLFAFRHFKLSKKLFLLP